MTAAKKKKSAPPGTKPRAATTPAEGDVLTRALPDAIKRYEADVPLDSLIPYPGNPKDHDIGAIITSIERNGVADVIKVQRSSRYILGGHGTAEALAHLKHQTCEVLWIDCDDRTARRLVLAYNRTPELGGFNQVALADFLTDSANAGDLLGTGYDAEDVDLLRASLTTPAFTPAGADEQGRLDQKTPITCPHCGKDFTR